MFREHGLTWQIVGFCSLALATPSLAQDEPQGLDEALRGQVARPAEPKREPSRTVLAPEFWSPSPTASDFIRELRETETTKLPSADTPYRGEDPSPSTYRSRNPPLSPERTIAYVALADPVPGTSLDRRCKQIRAEIEAERLRIENNGPLQGKEAVAAAYVNVWARHEGVRLARMLDPTSDVYRQRLQRMRAEKSPGETDQEIEERLKEQIRTQHIEQLLGASTIEAEAYRQRLPQLLAERKPDETEQDIKRRLREELRGPLGVGGKEIQVEWSAGEFWPHRTARDRNARFERLCHEMLDVSSISRHGPERLIHYVRAEDPRLTYEEARHVCESPHTKPPATQIYKNALELVGQERKADLLMRLSEMNAWEAAGRGTPEAYRQVEALMNRALDTALATNPRAKERTGYYQTQLHFTKDRAAEAVRAEFRTEFLLRLCDCPHDGRSPDERALDMVLATDAQARERMNAYRSRPAITLEKARERIRAEFNTHYRWRLHELTRGGLTLKDSDIPEAPLHPEYRVKQFVRENRLAHVTADADRLHGVLSPPAGQPPPTKEQVRDAVREVCANRGQDGVQKLRDLYRERWLRGAKEGEPHDLDGAIDAKLGDDLQLHDQCEASLNPAAAESLARRHAVTDKLHGMLCPPAGQPTGEQVRDAVREACADRSQDDVNELRLDYHRRWLKDLDKEVYGKLGDNRQLRKECQAFLHHPLRVKPNEGTN